MDQTANWLMNLLTNPTVSANWIYSESHRSDVANKLTDKLTDQVNT